jgi:hypothetical protein|tara:strand:+ start:1561 stop:1872 length:312 start_codon:yes stop_codon:yes gene_type:complete
MTHPEFPNIDIAFQEIALDNGVHDTAMTTQQYVARVVCNHWPYPSDYPTVDDLHNLEGTLDYMVPEEIAFMHTGEYIPTLCRSDNDLIHKVLNTYFNVMVPAS